VATLIHDLLSASAYRWPDHEAVRFEMSSLTYRDLDARSNQLARSLAKAGAGPGDRIGILMPKSGASIVALFGALKAGCVCVPLDHAAPAARIAYIANDCGIRIVLSVPTAEILQPFLAEAPRVETVVFLADEPAPPDAFANGRVVTWEAVVAEAASPVAPPGVGDEDLAYILYTSGSTGVPKGVMIPHRAVFAFASWSADRFGLTPDDRVTSHAPLHFDLSTFDVYATLKAGGTIVVVREQLGVFPSQLVDLLERERVTVTYLVPSILSLMLLYGRLETHDLSALRTVLFAGEVLPIKFLRGLAGALPGASFYNLYGPTETNVCTWYAVQPDDLGSDRIEPVPIGTACDYADILVLDDQRHLVDAPGRVGELWVRGASLALGYWNDPGLTAERFARPDPGSLETAYRTGDIVSLAADGRNWNFVGRLDHMVKSRGYRIELGEIEAALYAYGDVKEAAVITIPDELVGNRIRAFVVSGSRDLDLHDLERHCRERLPRYMLPESIQVVDGLPKTSTGKIDRPALVRAEIGETR
jgi:L-proline---[L-prolyl-carrier protein] ligase